MFDDLIQRVCSTEFQNILYSLGYTSMLVQSGKTNIANTVVESSKLDIQWYNYKPSLKEVSSSPMQ